MVAIAVHATPSHSGTLLADSDVIVNSYTTGEQIAADVMRQSDGSFVVVWTSDGQDGSGNGVFARRYDENGAALMTEFQVNSYTTGDQKRPSIALGAGNSFVIAWERVSGPGCVQAQAFDAQGVAVGTQFLAGAQLLGCDGFRRVHISGDGQGNFVSVWTGRDADANVFAQRFDSAGNLVGTEFQLNSYTTGGQFSPLISHGPDGGFFVTWRHIDPGGTGSEQNVRGRAFLADGTPTGPDFDISSGRVGTSLEVDVGALASGNYVVVWQNVSRIFASTYDKLGLPLTGTFVVEDSPGHWDRAGDPVLAPVSGDEFIVAWRGGNERVGDDGTIVARRMTGSGSGVGDAFVARHAVTREASVAGGIASNTAGSFVVAWTEADYDRGYSNLLHSGRDGSESAVMFTRLCDESDAACDVCAGFADEMDADGDSVPDGCDICTNVAGQRDMEKAKVSVHHIPVIRCAGSCGGNRVRASGRLTLDIPLADVQPETTGVRVLIEAASGGDIYDVSLPNGLYAGKGTRGWSVPRPGKWQYLDTTGETVNGVKKMLLLGNDVVGGKSELKVRLKTGLGFHPVREAMMPLRLTIRVDGMDTGPSTVCGEVMFALERCRFKRSKRNVWDTRIKCR